MLKSARLWLQKTAVIRGLPKLSQQKSSDNWSLRRLNHHANLLVIVPLL